MDNDGDDKYEAYNLKNKKCQAKFKNYTSNTNMLSSTIKEEGDINDVIKRFIKKVDGCVAANFNKRRVNRKKEDNTDKLYDKMRSLKNKEDPESVKELARCLETIADNADKNYKKVKHELEKLKPHDGKLDNKQVWKLKKALCPNALDAPCAMDDANGNLITSDKALQKRALHVYSDRLEGNKIEDNLKDLEDDTNLLCELRVKVSKENKTQPWTMEDMMEVLKHLKMDKSRDPDGWANELFKKDAAGTDLLEATLKLMNLIKSKQVYPNILEKCNITSIHKKKSKRDFENYRGIFRVQVLRSILDRLMYNDSYYTIDSNLTDGNVGARKHRSVRDNIFVLGAITNSVWNGQSGPIQIQVMDAIKCFDKLWLQACVNALYEAGINNDYLNILYSENRNAQIAVKINNKVSARISVKDVVMQGSIWGSLKCTSLMDTLNQTAMSDPSLQYMYKGDPTIPIGVMGMVDDTLAVSDCGSKAIRKNAVINSFMETNRISLSQEKSSVLHIGNMSKCALPCPNLKVHKYDMDKKKSTKYLGTILSSKGGLSDMIEDRRNQGWGKIATIMGILSEVDLGVHRLEVGLLLRKAILISSMLFTAEAWSGLTEKQLARLEVVDTSLLQKLAGGHVKCATEFYHLETATWKLRHHVSYLRIIYHQNILQREANETISKIYHKQKEGTVKGDWLKLLNEDFKFLGVDINEQEIISTPKEIYKKQIRNLMDKSVFRYFMNLKEGHTKLQGVEYKQFQLQPYLATMTLSNKEKELLFNLRSSCHSSKNNFRKMHRNNLECIFKCPQIEDQLQSFTACRPILSQVENAHSVQYENIFGSLHDQKETVKVFLKIEQTRQHVKKYHFSPGRDICQDPCTFGPFLDGAADV